MIELVASLYVLAAVAMYWHCGRWDRKWGFAPDRAVYACVALLWPLALGADAIHWARLKVREARR